MTAPSKIHTSQLVQIQPEEWVATTSELNLASSLVTGGDEARGMGYWAATHVKGLSSEITFVSEADVVHLTEGSTFIANSPNLRSWNRARSIETRRGDEGPTGSETVARYQKASMGTREAQSALLTGVCALKPINGKLVQMALWESDQLIVPEKRGNARGGKELAGARWTDGETPTIPRDGHEVSPKLRSITRHAREDPTCKFTSLAHLLTADFLTECFWELKRDKAPGIDGVTSQLPRCAGYVGHYQYYGISGNYRRIQSYYYHTLGLCFKWINRRNQKKSYNWSQFHHFLARNPLPKPKIYHFYVLSKRRGCAPEEPDEGKPHVRFCEGAHSNLGVNTPTGGGL